MDKSPEAFRTISEVAEWLDIPAHVLRFWESRFTQVKPVKRAGGRRYYRPNDMLLIGGIKTLLHDKGMTIRGVQKLLREEGVKHIITYSQPLDGSSTDENLVAEANVPEAPMIEDAKDIVENVLSIAEATRDKETEKRNTDLPPLFPEMEDDAPSHEDILTDPDQPERISAESLEDPEGEPVRPVVFGASIPDDDEAPVPPSGSGTSKLAASLRAMNSQKKARRPDPDTLNELYQKMVQLKSRMTESRTSG